MQRFELTMDYVEINEILPNPYQPRAVFKQEELWELAKSIREFGIIEPLIVRINEDRRYELIAGERRLRAAKLAGLEQVPIILRQYDDRRSAQIALIENLQRSDLNAVEEAKAYRQLLDKFGMTQEIVAQKVGKSRSHIANFLRLLHLTEPVLAMVGEGRLSMGQAKPLLALGGELQLRAAELIEERNLSARRAENLVKQLLRDAGALERIEAEAKQVPQDVYEADAVQRLKQVLGTNVNIKRGRHKSRLEIEFYSDEDLQRLIEAISGAEDKSGSPSGTGAKFTI